MFHNLSDIIDHKKHYCKLRFTCKCAPKISGSENDGRDSGMIIRGFNQIEPSILPRAVGTGGAGPPTPPPRFWQIRQPYFNQGGRGLVYYTPQIFRHSYGPAVRLMLRAARECERKTSNIIKAIRFVNSVCMIFSL